MLPAEAVAARAEPLPLRVEEREELPETHRVTEALPVPCPLELREACREAWAELEGLPLRLLPAEAEARPALLLMEAELLELPVLQPELLLLLLLLPLAEELPLMRPLLRVMLLEGQPEGL